MPKYSLPLMGLVWLSLSSGAWLDFCNNPFSLPVDLIGRFWAFNQGEAFVPEGIVRLGTRAGGRDGVQTLHTMDHRVKWVLNF